MSAAVTSAAPSRRDVDDPVCVACGARLEAVRPLGAARLADCSGCGSATAVPRPTEADLVTLHNAPEYFEKDYFDARRGQRADTARRVGRVLRWIEERRPGLSLTGRPVLDIGCDTGEFVIALGHAAEMTPFGVDVSSRAAAMASRRGVRVAATDISSAPAEFRDFAVATLIDVLEHVSEPARLLDDVAARLAPDAVVYVETPNWSSAVYGVAARVHRLTGGRPPAMFERLFPAEHVQYFTHAGLDAVVERTRLRVVHVDTRMLRPSAIAGSVLVRAASSAAQLPDVVTKHRILLCALLAPTGEPW